MQLDGVPGQEVRALQAIHSHGDRACAHRVRVDAQACMRWQRALYRFDLACEVVGRVLQAPVVVIVGDGQRALAARERCVGELGDIVRRGIDAVDRQRRAAALVAAQLDHARAAVHADPCALRVLIDMHAWFCRDQCLVRVLRG